ncbi:MAG: hypothetical protein HDT11_02595 [Helicobacter sp.]|nr:hypothetical protein [Helicobacter sp.]MDE7196082.1 hypothetical protein [Helicobacter sp.]
MVRKILLVLDGAVATDFLRNLCGRSTPYNSYLVVSKKPIDAQNAGQDFEFVVFDPTSPSKLFALLSKDILDALIIMENYAEGIEVYHILRSYSKRMAIVLLGDKLPKEDKNLSLVTEIPLVAAHFIEKVPNIPIISKDIGIHKGEIMEVTIPFGSSFAYRTIGSITQKKWKIVALYREGKMMLAKYSLTMQPNDSLLLVGEPSVLLEVYHSIKEELGQFPFPFGKNLVLYCDCSVESHEDVDNAISESLFLHKHFKGRKLYIRILHSSTPERVRKIRTLETSKLEVIVQYFTAPLAQIVQNDKATLASGLVLMRQNLFAKRDVRKMLYRLNVPVLRLGDNHFESLQGCAVVLDDGQQNEKISAVAFDVAAQLKQPVILYDFAPNLQYHTKTIEHFDSLAKIFKARLNVISTAMENPILWLMSHSEILGIFPFTEEMTNRQFLGPFTTHLGTLSLDFIGSHKLFVPISV